MSETIAGYPQVVSREEWLTARKELLAKEKEMTHLRDKLSAERRRLPMVEIDKEYTFEGPQGKVRLLDLFEGRRQLIIYHFMFDPNDPPAGRTHPFSEGCPGCSHVADSFPHLAHLHARGTSLAVVSRAKLAKIEPFKERMGWTFPWYSSFGSDFNYDFHVTADETVAPVEYNFQDKVALARGRENYQLQGELPGMSIFLRRGDRVFHAYSTYARGLDSVVSTYNWLDLTPFGRQEEGEDSPPGWPQTPMSWLRLHDSYEEVIKQQAPCCRTNS